MNTPETSAKPSGKRSVPGRRERRKQALRQRIFEVSVGLFTTQGFDATTIEQIAEAADVVPATFFNHFQNKQVVLIEMTNLVITHLQSMLDEQFERDADTRTRLIGFANAAASDIGQARGIARDVVLTMVRSETKGAEPPYLVRVHQPFAEMLREGQERGEVRDDADAEFLAEMVVGMLNATVTGWLASSDYPIEKRICQAAEFAWETVAAKPSATPSAGNPSATKSSRAARPASNSRASASSKRARSTPRSGRSKKD